MIRPLATSIALGFALFAGSTGHAQSQSRNVSPQCREAKQNALISGAAATVATGTCFVSRNPAPCAVAGIAAVKFAADTQKMLRVCQPPAPRPATPRVAPPRRGR